MWWIFKISAGDSKHMLHKISSHRERENETKKAMSYLMRCRHQTPIGGGEELEVFAISHNIRCKETIKLYFYNRFDSCLLLVFTLEWVCLFSFIITIPEDTPSHRLLLHLLRDSATHVFIHCHLHTAKYHPTATEHSSIIKSANTRSLYKQSKHPSQVDRYHSSAYEMLNIAYSLFD